MNCRFRPIFLLLLLMAAVGGVASWRETMPSPGRAAALSSNQCREASELPAPWHAPESGTVGAAPSSAIPPQTNKPSALPAAVLRDTSVLEQVAAAMYWLTSREAQWNRGEGAGGANRAQELTVHFDGAGVLVRPAGAGDAPAWTWALEFDGRKALPVSDGKTRISYDRGEGVTEWFENKPEGIEHGFTLDHGTARTAAGEVRLPLVMRTGLTAESTEDKRSLILQDPEGTVALRYENLLAWDATGRHLPARMELAAALPGEQGLTLVVEAGDAVFPVVVDPLITRTNGHLLPSPAVPDGWAGYAVAVSGNVAAVAAPGNLSNSTGPAGTVHLYEKKLAGWVLLKTLNAPAGGRAFGLNLALSGPHLAVTQASGNGNNDTDVLLYRRDLGGTDNWGHVSTLTGSVDAFIGIDMDIEDGRMVIAEINLGTGASSVYLYDLTAAGWGLTKILPLPSAPGSPVAGFSVSLGSGGRLAVGAIGSGAAGGLVEIRQQNLGGVNNWGVERTVFQPSGATGFGRAVSLCGDLLVVGAPQRASGGVEAGNCYIYRQNQGGANLWGQLAVLGATTPVQDGRFGFSVDMDGSTLVVGAAIGAATGDDPGCFLYQYDPAGAPPFTLVRSFTDTGEAGTDISFRKHFVAVSGDVVLLGNHTADAPGPLTNAGRAVVIEQLEGCWTHVASPGADLVAAGMGFGASIDMEGDLLAVGAPGTDNAAQGGADAGAVFVFTRSDDLWTLQRRLDGGTLTVAGDRFGSAVALCGDLLAVGSPGLDNATITGAVHLFRQHGDAGFDWDEVRRIVPVGAGLPRGFGTAVALEENWLAVGYPGAGNGGQVRMFARNVGVADNWSQRDIVENPAPVAQAAGDGFGFAVSLSGSFLAAGAPFAEGRGLRGFQQVPLDQAGRVYLFEENVGGGSNWGLTALLPAAPLNTDLFGEEEGRFGRSVCLRGTHLAIGAPGENNGSGRVYVHERTVGLAFVTWGQRAEITAPAALPVQSLGYGVALEDDTVAAAATWQESLGRGAGVACVFQRNNGGANQFGFVGMAAASAFRHPVGIRGAQMSIALWGRQLALGTPQADLSGSGAGQVDVFFRQDDRWALTRNAAALVPVTGGYGYPPDSIDIDNDHAAVGYWSTPDDSSVFVLERNQGGAGQWGVVKKITETGPDSLVFGRSLALSGRHLAVGAPSASLNGLSGNGVVYLYEQNTSGENNWGFLTRFAGAQPGERLGYDVALDGRRLLAGAPDHDANNFVLRSGGVYVYEYSSGVAPHWSGPVVFIAATPVEDDRFGHSVALDGDIAAVGVPFAGTGRVSVHRRNEGGINAWGRSALISNPFAGGALHGYNSVAMSGGWLAAGSLKDGTAAWGVGLTNLASVLDPQPPPFNLATRRVTFPAGTDQAGFMQDISGGTMVAADAPWEDLVGTALYVFSRNLGGAGAWGLETTISQPGLCAVAISGRTIIAAGTSSLRLYELTGSDYDNWLRRQFTDNTVNNPALEAGVWGPEADPDKDGMVNLEEAYGGTNPLAGQAGLLRQAGRDATTGEFWFRWRQGGDDHGVRASPQWSVNLQKWYAPGESAPLSGFPPVRITIRPSGTLDDGTEWEARMSPLAAESIYWRLFLWRE